jgi:hypothetical protein
MSQKNLVSNASQKRWYSHRNAVGIKGKEVEPAGFHGTAHIQPGEEASATALCHEGPVGEGIAQ